MGMDPNELVLPLRIDTSQVRQDLQAVDRELAAIERRAVAIFNRSPLTRQYGFAKASSMSEVQAALKGFQPAQIQTALPELYRTMTAHSQRLTAIERQAAAGRGVLPPTERQLAQQRLGAVERLNRAIPVEMSQQGTDRLARGFAGALLRGGPNLAGMLAS